MKTTLFSSCTPLLLAAITFTCNRVLADDDHDKRDESKDLPTYAQLHAALKTSSLTAITAASASTCGPPLSIATASSGRRFLRATTRRPMARQPCHLGRKRRTTANAFSLKGLPLSTANLYAAVQPGGTLFGLQESNPVDTGVAYGGHSSSYGKRNDPMVGKKIGGINVFGGGLALYDKQGNSLGASA